MICRVHNLISSRGRVQPEPSRESPLRPLRWGQGSSAFTLIEVLLAMLIFAIVLTAVHLVFYNAVRLRNKTSEALEEALPLEQTVAVLKNDLANIVMPGGMFFGELQTDQVIGSSSNSLNTLAPVGQSVPGDSSPAFFTASGIIQEDLPWAEVERVFYYLAAPTNNTPGKDLIRSVTRNLLPVLQEQPEEQFLMSGVESIAFSFYDGLQWRDYWDSTSETNRLPQGVKVELQLAADPSSGIRPVPVELVVPLVLQASTNQTFAMNGGEP